MYYHYDWAEYANEMGYDNERAMWNELYVKQGLGGKAIEKAMQKVVKMPPTAPTILKRLKELHYEIKPPGGANYKGYYAQRLKELGGSKLARMTREEICKRIRYSSLDPHRFYRIMKELGYTYIKTDNRPKEA